MVDLKGMDKAVSVVGGAGSVGEEEAPKFMGGESGIKAELARLDSLVQTDNNIGQFDMAEAKSCIMNVMVEIRKHPEHNALLVDKDIHNVMVFSQMTKHLAQANMTAKITKKTASKAKRKAKESKYDFGDMDDLLGDFKLGG